MVARGRGRGMGGKGSDRRGGKCVAAAVRDLDVQRGMGHTLKADGHATKCRD